MAWIVLGLIVAAVASIIGTYLVIRIGVRDGIDTSSAADWRIAYAMEQEKNDDLPSLESMREEVARSRHVTEAPAELRAQIIDETMRRRVMKKVGDSRNRRFVGAVVGVVIALIVSGVMIGYGQYEQTRKSYHSPSYYSYLG